MIHILSKEKINKHFSDEKIQAYMRELGLTKLESILYLWFYNNAHIKLDDFKKDNGRPMFVRFAKSITDLIKECKKDKTVLDEIEEIAKHYSKMCNGAGGQSMTLQSRHLGMAEVGREILQKIKEVKGNLYGN